MMKKLLILALTAFSLTAIESDAKGIAIVDEMKVFDQTDEAKKTREMLKEEDAKIQKRITEMKQDFLRRQEELKQKRAILSDEKFLDEETALRKLMTRYGAEEKEMVAGLEKNLAEKRRAILMEIRNVVEEIAKSRGYDAVLSKGTLLYNVEKIDISAEVLEKVNKRLNTKG